MQRRPPMAWVAGVLATHLVLLAASLRHHPPARMDPGLGALRGPRLILLDAAQVTALSIPGSAAGPAVLSPVQLPASAVANAASPASLSADDAASAAAARLARTSGATAIGAYRPPSALDYPVRPRSAPDLSMLAGPPWSGVPLRIRLFIDVSGAVVDVQVLQSAEEDELVQRVRQMFLATGFTPGLENGKPVPCYKDIEMNASPPA